MSGWHSVNVIHIPGDPLGSMQDISLDSFPSRVIRVQVISYIHTSRWIFRKIWIKYFITNNALTIWIPKYDMAVDQHSFRQDKVQKFSQHVDDWKRSTRFFQLASAH